MGLVIKNDSGEIISGIKKLQKKEFGTGKINKDGEAIVDWGLLSEYADQDGFDKRNQESNGQHRIEMVLPRDTVIIRYGNETGRFSAPKGTDYAELSLPYQRSSVAYHEYRVITEDVLIYCIVDKGIVAPGFDSLGGGIQYMHKKTMIELLKGQSIERIVV